MVFKKLLVTMLALLLLSTTACNEGSTEKRENHIPISGIASSIKSNEIILNSPVAGSILKVDVQNWCEYIEEKFGYKIQFKAVASTMRQFSQMLYSTGDSFGLNTKNNIVKAEDGGIFYLGGLFYLTLKELIDYNSILPIDAYLDSNSFWQEIPDEIKNNYIYGDSDNVWAIPFSFEPFMFARQYNSKWLENIQSETPQTIDELYEVLKGFTYNDPDKNGINDTQGLICWPDVPNRCFVDIFNAFGCTISQNRDDVLPVIYNFETQSFKDSMFNENMKAAMTFIKTLNDEGMITSFDTNKYGSRPRWNIRYFNSDIYNYSFSLSGLVDNNITPLSYGYQDGFYVLSSKTENAKDMINNFVDLFYKDMEGHLIAQYGLKKNNAVYNYENNVVSLYNINKIPNINTPAINGELSKQIEDKYIYEYSDNSIKDYFLYDEVKYKIIAGGIATGDYYYMPFKYDIFNYSNNETMLSNISKEFNSALKLLMSNNVSVDEIIENYKSNIDKLNSDKMISRLNEYVKN